MRIMDSDNEFHSVISAGLSDLVQELTRLGVRLNADGDRLEIQAPKGVLSAALRDRLGAHKDELLALLRRDTGTGTQTHPPAVVVDAEQRYQPFPLTGVQHAYWLGRDSALEMGNVATHFYIELHCSDLDVSRLNDALCCVIDRHDMLRAIINPDGTQRILSSVPRYRIAVDDQSRSSPAAAERAILASRNDLSHQVVKTERWPLFEVRATLLPENRMRLHVSLDLLILDAWSIFLFFREWHSLYRQPDVPWPALGLSFRDYVMAEMNHENSAAYRRALTYWMARIDSLPPAPELPLRPEPSVRRSPRFVRREMRMPKDYWQKLKATARAYGLTPSGVLLAAYSEILARWSASPHFTINLTVSNRRPVHADVDRLLGDFTSLILQEVDRRDYRQTFLQFARELQQQFARDMDHRDVSGVVVLREWAKRRGLGLAAVMPVVFSSGLVWTGDEEVGDLEQFGKKVYSISQTSQVWLDHHVMELQGDLYFVWDAAEAVFEDGVLGAMFSSYCDLIGRLADRPEIWEDCDVVPLPAAMAARCRKTNRTDDLLPDYPLHAGLVRNAFADPRAIAVFSPARTLTYGELLIEASAAADWLLDNGVRPGQLVAIAMHKGWEQAVAAAGILLAGGAYLPVDAGLPIKRQRELLRIAGIAHVLTQPDTLHKDVRGAHAVHEIHAGTQGRFGAHHRRSLDVSLNALAYVIFTSGTTGVPKGVMIDHRGAMNTIMHVNRLLGIERTDRVLAVSSLSFDLSVYDLFGLFDAGGALVIPDARKGHDPVHWRELLQRHAVTVWNSAPQLMRMLMDSFNIGDTDRAPLCKVLLSGDFIPLDLPARIRQRYRQAQVTSLGGATEASIWSIYHPVRSVDPVWTSIPYGRPLPNQTVWVLDSAFRACPDYARGRIFIGGVGLAQGYWHDEEKTAARFIHHPHTGERLYDTGDLGRYAPDGNILIIGREDGQIKIRGHRVELGEIESVLREHTQVRQAVVIPVDGPGETRQLAAYVVSACDPQMLKEFVAERLPDYMVPRHVFAIDQIPVSANGKIDYRALPVLTAVSQSDPRSAARPPDDIERIILAAWSAVIAGCEIGVGDNFFELGGDSVMATQLVRELNEALPSFALEMHELFENLTVESLAALYRTRSGEGSADTETARAVEAPSVDREAMIADLAVAKAQIEMIDFTAPARAVAEAPKTILLTGGTGWIGAHVLAELLTHTRARIFCLVRSQGAGHDRLFGGLRLYGIPIDPSWPRRVEAVPGDLAEPLWGLKTRDWQQLAETVDAVYHLAATVNVLADYAAHSRTNVGAVVTLVRLAAEHHCKPVFFTSPMTVCRRHKEGRLVILHQERALPDPDGLLTGYAQSKWAAEQLLLAAMARGLPVKIYRSSHALPSTRNGLAKPNDTYGSVLKIACEAGVVPEWTDSGLHGVPVDILARLIVEDALAANDHRGIVHVENRDPLDFKTLLHVLLDRPEDGIRAPSVSLDEWKARCRDAAARLPGETAALAHLLFTERGQGAAVEHMFAAHLIDTSHFDARGKTARLSGLTPPDYWRRVRSHPSWPAPVPSPVF